jgi:hypothetical protein
MARSNGGVNESKAALNDVVRKLSLDITFKRVPRAARKSGHYYHSSGRLYSAE